jgi:hypothetical protein
VGSDGAFGDGADGRGVITQKGKGAFAGINCLGKDILVNNNVDKFKVADRESAVGVGIGDKFHLEDSGRKWGPPKQKPYTAHARKCGVDSTNAGRRIGNQFRQASWA